MDDVLGCKEQFEILADGLLIRAPAKINLSLLVAGKRGDGFHELETIMAKVSFYDELLFENSEIEGIELVCEGPQWAPAGKENLVFKACESLFARAGRKPAIKITLTKNIPAGAGLGGGSSDAAAALMGLNKFVGLGASAEELAEIALELGSDVPFFLDGPIALCRGRGEKTAPIGGKTQFYATVILCDINVETKKVYGNYVHDKELYSQLSSKINVFLAENRLDLVANLCANMLEYSCFELYGGLAQLKTTIRHLGISPLCLSGSGSAMFLISSETDFQHAKQSRHRLKKLPGCEVVVVHSNRW